jgi:glycerate kinase
MRILVAPDSFKGSLGALEAANAIARGVMRARPDALVEKCPLSDGGEGFASVLGKAKRGTERTSRVTGPRGAPVRAGWTLSDDGVTAVIESAAAVGLDLVPSDERNASETTTRGVGELVREALDAGAARIVVGLGGTGTTDGGAGMAQALGVRLLDAAGADLPPGGAALARLARIDTSGLDPRLAATEIRVACDVSNPLVGPEGASAVYGPQKGATPESCGETCT